MAASDLLDNFGLDEQSIERLRRALNASDRADLATRIEILRSIATRELIDWILGRQRYQTLAESDASRVLQIYDQIRHQWPNRSSLANDFSFSPGRATSIAARLRYGEGQRFDVLRYQSASDEIKAQVDKARKGKEDERLTVRMTLETADTIMGVSSDVFLDIAEQARGKKWEGAEMMEEQRKSQVALVTGSVRMWSYVYDEMDERKSALPS